MCALPNSNLFHYLQLYNRLHGFLFFVPCEPLLAIASASLACTSLFTSVVLVHRYDRLETDDACAHDVVSWTHFYTPPLTDWIISAWASHRSLFNEIRFPIRSLVICNTKFSPAMGSHLPCPQCYGGPQRHGWNMLCCWFWAVCGRRIDLVLANHLGKLTEFHPASSSKGKTRTWYGLKDHKLSFYLEVLFLLEIWTIFCQCDWIVGFSRFLWGVFKVTVCNFSRCIYNVLVVSLTVLYHRQARISKQGEWV